MKLLEILPVVLISGIIGYITNVIAVKCLFRPLEPVKIPLFGNFQGLIPKRKKELAQSIGRMIEEELVREEDLVAQLITEEDQERMKNYLTGRVGRILDEKLSLFPSGIREKILVAVEDKLEREKEPLFREVRNAVENQVKNKMDISAMVEEKILALDLEKMESMILTIAGRELKHIEWLGLVMGLGIGVVQGLFVLWLG